MNSRIQMESWLLVPRFEKALKRVRAKSVVLAEPLRNGELAMIGYECWACGRVEERNGNISAFIVGYGD